MLRILIAEDSPSSSLFLETVLSEYGRVDTAADGVEAVDIFQKALENGEPHDLLVLDIMMPGMDGLTALCRMVEIHQSLGLADRDRPKAVMASCLTDPRHMMKAHFECGADIYITKPYTAKIIQEALANLNLIDSPVDVEDV